MEGQSRARCPLCDRWIHVKLNGNLKIHGPIANRYFGSDSPPNPSPSIVSDVVTQCVSTHDEGCPEESETVVSTDAQVPAATVVNPGRPVQRILKRIPRAARGSVSRKLKLILRDVVRDNSCVAWERLFLCARRCLYSPNRGGHRRNLAKLVNEATVCE